MFTHAFHSQGFLCTQGGSLLPAPGQSGTLWVVGTPEQLLALVPNTIFHLPSPTVCFGSLITHHSPCNIAELLHLANGVFELDVRGDFSCLNRNKLQKSIHRAVDVGFWGLLIFRTH